MICTENIHRITKYFLLSILILFHLSVAQDEKVQRLTDEDQFLQMSASRSPYDLDGTRAINYQPKNIGYKTQSQHFKTVFFIILGIGLAIIVSLLFVCFKVAKVYDGANTSTIVGGTIQSLNTQATYNNQTGVAMSYVNTAFTREPQGTDRPPDYTTVTATDSVNRNAAFPQVVTTHMETPPPKYEDRPIFK